MSIVGDFFGCFEVILRHRHQVLPELGASVEVIGIKKIGREQGILRGSLDDS